MFIEKLFHKKERTEPASVQVGFSAGRPLWRDTLPCRRGEWQVYDRLREQIPLIDAALDKIIRLTGTFRVVSPRPDLERKLNAFFASVSLGGTERGISRFLCQYLSDLLTYGTAAGEMVLTGDKRRIAAVLNCPLEGLEAEWAQTRDQKENPLEIRFFVRRGGEKLPVQYPQLILFSALNPRPGEIWGTSLLRSLPAVSEILLHIFQAVGQNFERMGNLRFAVVYKPGQNERAGAKEIAQNLAREWSETMAGSPNGEIRDFIAVGDLDIRVIGADCQMLDCQVPVRQLLEQMVAKLGLPPFLLGLNWSTTERMSRQQADILTSELEYYRGLLTPVLTRIGELYLSLEGEEGEFSIDWSVINLQDETDMAQARLLNAQAEKLEAANRKGDIL